MATDKDIHAQAESFLNAMAPKPGPPPSRRKKEEQQSEIVKTGNILSSNLNSTPDGITETEQAFIQKYVLDRSNSVCNTPSRQVLLNSEIQSRLHKYVKKVTGGRGSLSTMLNNILAEFIANNEDVLSSSFQKFNNEKF